MLKKSFIALVVCFAFYQAGSAQTNFNRYEFRNMSEIIAITANKLTNKAQITISAKPFPAKTTVKYLGKRRKADTLTNSLIELWGQSLNVPAANVALLTEEILFSEKGVEFWMPVHAKIAPALESAFSAGDEVVIYYFFMGGYNPAQLNKKRIEKATDLNDTSNAMRWIFVVETFDVPKPAAPVGSSFVTRKLDTAIDRSAESKIDDYWIDPRQERSKWTMTYSGETRPISSGRRELISRWLKFSDIGQAALDLMSTEARFTDDDKDYWMPVRRSVLEAMKTSFKKGETLTPHTVLIGGRRDGGSVDWVFLVGDFSN